MKPQEIVDRIAHSREVIEFATTPARALVIVSNLQLALRHPANTGDSAAIAREIVANLAQAIATVTDCPEVLEVVAMGAHPEFDLSRDEAATYFDAPDDEEPSDAY